MTATSPVGLLRRAVVLPVKPMVGTGVLTFTAGATVGGLSVRALGSPSASGEVD